MSKKTTASRIKTEAVDHWVPADRDQVNEAIAEIGRLQRERARIETTMNDRLAEVKAAHDADAKPLGERIAELHKGVSLWCEANRAKLTNEGKVKFHEFATGKVNWRLRPPSISIRGLDAVAAYLKKAALERFLRVKQEIDKEALLREPDVAREIPGVTISQREDFVVVPNESQIEEVQS
ncbi:host-nuclease inhibitor Gam family protein [Stenotrophomonas sp.]|uniref:host-nuclease inhibitor Gam family protein n=1 Tax=Stenotrophomonas sp. TaxID=69392 RepID=UPI0025D37027|nr:host-nuclease inhibitor Gam family protein [Stenotrophomonas sp.]